MNPPPAPTAWLPESIKGNVPGTRFRVHGALAISRMGIFQAEMILSFILKSWKSLLYGDWDNKKGVRKLHNRNFQGWTEVAATQGRESPLLSSRIIARRRQPLSRTLKQPNHCSQITAQPPSWPGVAGVLVVTGSDGFKSLYLYPTVEYVYGLASEGRLLTLMRNRPLC